VENLCRAAETMLPEVHIDYRSEAAALCVSADRALLEQILCHILSNAVAYGGEDRTVTVRLQRTKNRAMVHVSDTGKGIRAQAAPHVFDAYYSCDPYGDTEERPGDGLGLYLVRYGLRAMGGECAMESEFGCGTQLSFALPLAEETQTAVRARLAEYLLDRFSCAYVHFCPLGASLWP
jgi:signal transduction histidine kinase